MTNKGIPMPHKLSLTYDIIADKHDKKLCTCSECGMKFPDTPENRTQHNIMHRKIAFASMVQPMYTSIKEANAAYDILNDTMWGNGSFGVKLSAAENLLIAKWSAHFIGRMSIGAVDKTNSFEKYAAEFIDVNENYFPTDIYEVLCARHEVKKTYHTTLPIQKYDRLMRGDINYGPDYEPESESEDSQE